MTWQLHAVLAGISPSLVAACWIQGWFASWGMDDTIHR